MTRRFTGIAVASLLGVMSLSQPWSSGAAQAGLSPKPAPAVAAACKGTRGQLAHAQAQIEQLRSDNQQLQRELAAMLAAERARVKKLEDQLGAPMIEHLH